MLHRNFARLLLTVAAFGGCIVFPGCATHPSTRQSVDVIPGLGQSAVADNAVELPSAFGQPAPPPQPRAISYTEAEMASWQQPRGYASHGRSTRDANCKT